MLRRQRRTVGNEGGAVVGAGGERVLALVQVVGLPVGVQRGNYGSGTRVHFLCIRRLNSANVVPSSIIISVSSLPVGFLTSISID